jgi:hypothetical protein
MSKATAVDVLYQDIIQIEKTVSGLSAQVVRLQRLVNIDKAEAAVGEQRSRTELVTAINNQTDLLTDLLKRETQMSVEDRLVQGYLLDKMDRAASVQKGIAYLRYLERCKQTVTDRCPCGQHKGIRFLDKDGNIIEERCPKSWWVSLSRIAYEDGNLSGFVESTPMETFLKLYGV